MQFAVTMHLNFLRFFFLES